MGFLDFGKLPVGAMEGMSYQPNWDAMMGRAQQQEMAFLQASQIREEKLKSAAQMLATPITSTPINNRRQEGYIKGLMDEFNTYKAQHPNFESTLEGQQYLYGLSQKIQNNPHKQADARTMDEYKRFRDAVANGKFNGNTEMMLKEQERFNAYANQKEGDNVPEYIYKPPMPIDAVGIIKKALASGYKIEPSSYVDKNGMEVKYFPPDQIKKLSYLIATNPESKGQLQQAYLSASEDDPLKKDTKSIYDYIGNLIKTQFNDQKTAGSLARYNWMLQNKGKLNAETPWIVNVKGVTDKTRIHGDPAIAYAITGAYYNSAKGFGAISGDGHVYVQGRIINHKYLQGVDDRKTNTSDWVDLSKYPAGFDNAANVVHHPMNHNAYGVKGNVFYTKKQKDEILANEGDKGITADMFVEHTPQKEFIDQYGGQLGISGGTWLLRGAVMDADFSDYNRSAMANYNLHYGYKWANQVESLINLPQENPVENQPQEENLWNWNEPAEK